jgi:hypothetical protein
MAGPACDPHSPPPIDPDDDVPDVACAGCGSGQVDSTFFNQFGLFVCRNCTRTDPEFALLSATESKARFALTDADLKRAALPHLVRKSTKHRADGLVKLYCVSQVMALAVTKHGTEEGVEAARDRRVDASLARRADKKRRDVLHGEDGDEDEHGGGGAMQHTQPAGAKRRAPALPEPHTTHVYLSAPVANADGVHVRTCDICGAAEEVEVM